MAMSGNSSQSRSRNKAEALIPGGVAFFIALVLLCLSPSAFAGPDVDWHIGPLSGLYLNMSIKEVPDSLNVDASGISNFMETTRTGFLNMCSDKRHLFVPLRLKASFSLWGIPSDSQELLFVGDFDWSSFLDAVSRNQTAFQDDRFQSAIMGSRLSSITLFSAKDQMAQATFLLTQHFGNGGQTQKSSAATFYLVTAAGSVDLITFWYVTHSWRIGQTVVECLESYENGRITASSVILRSDRSIMPDQLPASFVNTEGVVSPETLSKFMDSIRNKSWHVGYGWAVESLGHPLGDFNPWGFPYWPWKSDKSNVLYIVNCGRVFRFFTLSFSDNGLLKSTDLSPQAESVPECRIDEAGSW
jgi:hypothetical protein